MLLLRSFFLSFLFFLWFSWGEESRNVLWRELLFLGMVGDWMVGGWWVLIRKVEGLG